MELFHFHFKVAKYILDTYLLDNQYSDLSANQANSAKQKQYIYYIHYFELIEEYY